MSKNVIPYDNLNGKLSFPQIHIPCPAIPKNELRRPEDLCKSVENLLKADSDSRMGKGPK